MTAPPPAPPALSPERLGRWLHDELTVGRWPFRTVEQQVPILIENGEVHVPLVLWINRDSLLCGGLIFFAGEATAEVATSAAHCATTLGLPSFLMVTEKAVEVRLVSAPEAASLTHPLPRAPFGLLPLLEACKQQTLATTLSPPPPTACYFATLCLQALNVIIPLLDARLRELRATGERGIGTSRNPAAELATLHLWRLLALMLQQQLPGQLRPEDIQNQLKTRIDRLSPQLLPHLAITAEEVTLPPSCAVRFHHLLHRLTQLRFASEPERAAATIERLLQALGNRLGVAPPPIFADSTVANLTLFADRYHRGETIIAPPAVLAGIALSCMLRQQPPPASAVSLFDYRFPTQATCYIRGSLLQATLLTERQRREMALHLRRSWPTRRFRLTGAPLWLAQFIPLLGVVPAGSRLCLALPDQLLLRREHRTILALVAAETEIMGVNGTAGKIVIELERRRGGDSQTEPGTLRCAFAAAAQDDTAHERLGRELCGLPSPVRARTGPPRRNARLGLRHLSEQIVGEVFRDGIPRFPEHYLYDHYRPQLKNFSVAPPLTVAGRFFAQVTLSDAAGTTLTTEKATTALALLLAGHRQHAFALPTEEELTTAIVVRYRRDLQRLYTALRASVYRHHGSGPRAERLIRELWERFDLPPVSLFAPHGDPLGEGLPLHLPAEL